MPDLRLSVRARLLAVCLGLMAVFGGTSVLLGYLIFRNQADQRAIEEQYRRFERIQTVQQDVLAYRHEGSQLNVAIMQRDRDRQAQAQAATDRAAAQLERSLGELQGFDPDAAAAIRDELRSGLEQKSSAAIAAFVRGDQAEAARILGQLQRSFAHIEQLLQAATRTQRDLSNDILERGARRAKTASELAIGVLLGGLVFGLLLVRWVVHSILQPLEHVTSAIRQVNAGALEIELPPITADEFGETARALYQFRDRADRLRRLAYEDPLTGLGNRARLEEDLQAAIRDRRGESALALFALDLDNFRAVNDRLGYRGGDRYLLEAVARLRRAAAPRSRLYRTGGDKFALLLDELPAQPALEGRLKVLADALLSAFGVPYSLDGQLLNMSVSIGIAIHPGDGGDAGQLLSAAEAAVHAAKRSGRNNARFAAAQHTAALRAEQRLAVEMRRGLEAGEFEPHYQPIVDAAARRVIGAEALLRWRHPERGLLLPGSFIPAAENQGLINALGEYCLRAVHAQLRQWRKAGRSWRVAVNLSARQLREAQVLKPLAALYAEDAAASALLELELTESMLFDNSDDTRRVLETARRQGYRLGLDDFGTGYSSLGALQRLPLDKLKIDRSFVAEMEQSKSAQAIVSATLALAAALELEVVAEGVETEAQSQTLLRQGCRVQQGFHFSKALPAAEYEHWALAFEGMRPTSHSRG